MADAASQALSPLSFLPEPPEMADGRLIGIYSPKLASIPNLEAFLGAGIKKYPWMSGKLGAMAGWGVQGLSAWTRNRARKRRLPFLAVDDGLFRSLDYRRLPFQPYSLVVDYSGIYYDGTHPSDLETLLNSDGWETPELLAEAHEAMAFIQSHHLSKYNHAPDASPYLLTTPGMRTRILILDQPVDDRRVHLGMADSQTFARMIAKAREDHPGAALFLKTHPAVLSGLRKGYLANTPAAKGVNLLTQDVSPSSLLAQADEVYTVSSQMGFEALMLGKRVHCFGLPFYAGWGLTEDSIQCPRRTKTRSAEELFAATCLLCSRYANPVTGQRCSLRDVLRLLAEQRRQNERNSRYTVCLGFSRREFEVARTFLSSTSGEVVQTGPDALELAAEKAEIHNGRLAALGDKVNPGLVKICAAHGISLVRVQKGFLPDFGSASGAPLFSKPVSLIMDERGLLDDSSKPDELEMLLEHGPVTEEDRIRGRNLLRFLKEGGLLLNSEFAGMKVSDLPEALASIPQARRIILVLGQDGDPFEPRIQNAERQGIQTMAGLVQVVREARPDDFILFLNTPGKDNLDAGDLPDADLVLQGVSPLKLFPAVAEVHTFSSLCGLDALIRGLPVYTYGGPFYAGWGLTTDRLNFRRRSRVLSLEMLLLAALDLYPAYYDWHMRMFCGVEDICRLHELPPRPRLPLLERLNRFVEWRRESGS